METVSPRILLTILLALRTAAKFSFPKGVKIVRPVEPLFTGTQLPQTVARKVAMPSHSEHKSRCIASLRIPENRGMNMALFCVGSYHVYIYIYRYHIMDMLLYYCIMHI